MVNEIVACDVTESDTVIVSGYVPYVNPVVVIAPVEVLIERPLCVGLIEYVLVPVPPVTVNPDDVNAKPSVVLKLEIPETDIVSLTKTETLTEELPFSASVAVMDSLYVPFGAFDAMVIYPVLVSIEM